MEIVHQRFEYDCSLAAIAMFAGKTYDEVSDIAAKQGYHRNPDATKGFTSCESYVIMRKLGIRPFTIDEAYGSMPGILSLPSLNKDGGAHACFYDGYTIFDPQTDRPGKKWYDPKLPFWPSCYKITVDLNHPYSMEMAEFWVAHKNSQLKNAKEGRF